MIMTKDEIRKYLHSNEIDVQNAKAAFIVADLVYDAYVESDSVHGIIYSPVSCYFFGDSNNFYQLLDKTHVRKVAHKMYDDYLADQTILKKQIKAHEKLTREMDALWEGFSPQEISNENLLSFYDKFINCAHRWWHYGVIGEDKGAVITDKVVPNFQKRHNLSLDEAQHIISALSHPNEQSVLNIERKKFLNLCLYLKDKDNLIKLINSRKYEELMNDEKTSEKVSDYLKSGFWIKTDFYNAVIITPEILFSEVLAYLSNSKQYIQQELQQIDQSFEKIKNEKSEILSKFNFNQFDRLDIEFSQLIVHWIDTRKEGMMKQLHYFICLVKEIAARFSLSYDDATRYSVKELRKLLERGIRTDLSMFKSGGFVFYEKNEKTRIFYGKEGEELLSIAKHIKTEDYLKGMVASKGKKQIIKGQIQIIRDPQNQDFLAGSILVTSMTRVEFVPLMRRAKAIITNEGGIACHAAIVSRELGIPCIIGTKNATDILKSGDCVEMNLKNGTIKILNSNK